MKLAVDAMLGKLARWLRALGYDSLYNNSIDDDELLDQARRQGRVLITRDRVLHERCGDVPSILIVANDVESQIREFMDAMKTGPDPALFFTRCIECNEALERIGHEEADGRVPEFILLKHDRFSRCPACGKVFWQGSHHDGMRGKFLEILGKASNP